MIHELDGENVPWFMIYNKDCKINKVRRTIKH